MADGTLIISKLLKFEITTPPRGMNDYDPTALTPQQQIELNEYKMNLRRNNWSLLGSYPEIKALISMILRMTLVQRPRNIPEYLAQVFSRPEADIRKDVKKILNERDFEYEGIPLSDFEDWDY